MRGIVLTIMLVAGIAVAAARGGDRAADGAVGPVAADPAPAATTAGAATSETAAPAAQEADPQAAEAFAPVVALFDAMRAKDTVALAAVFHPEARLNSTSVRDGRPVVSSSPVDGFVRSIGAAEPELDERLGPEIVRVDGDLATAWTPYAFFVDGEFSHCGVNAFQLVRTEDGWKILQITDTRRREACPEGAPR